MEHTRLTDEINIKDVKDNTDASLVLILSPIIYVPHV